MARSSVPAAPLTSLTQAGSRAGHACTECGSDRVTRIAMTLTDGSPVDFAHCLNCEHRSWEQAGKALSLTRVLNKARKAR
jgi:ribosomal protein L37AE/L43A